MRGIVFASSIAVALTALTRPVLSQSPEMTRNDALAAIPLWFKVMVVSVLVGLVLFASFGGRHPDGSGGLFSRDCDDGDGGDGGGD